MRINSENPVSIIHLTHNMLRRREDKIFAQHGLTTEQYEVLTAVKTLEAPVRITDVAVRLVRSTNSVSMIVDRMVKAGLLNRWRDEDDRRTVHVGVTDEAETRLATATPAAEEFVRETLSELSHDDRHDLLVLLGIIAEETTRERKSAAV